MPLVIGTRGWGLFVESRRPGVFDVARASDTRIATTWGTDALAFHLFTAARPLDVLARYYDVTGYPGLPAPWALGPLIWRDENRDQAQVLDDINQIRSRHLATTGVWFDRPYATGVETFDWDAAKFPDHTAMLQALHDAGLRYAIWQAPYTGDATHPDAAPAQLAYATAHGFFPPTTGVLVNAWGKPIDFTNPDAYAWWQQNLRAYSDGDGVEGFKLDYAEDVVLGVAGHRTPWLFHDGSDERTMHYDYQLLYHRAYREVMPAAGGFLLTRTGRWGDQVHGTIIWPGDLDASFAHAGDTIARSVDARGRWATGGADEGPRTVGVGVPVLRERHRRLSPLASRPRGVAALGRGERGVAGDGGRRLVEPDAVGAHRRQRPRRRRARHLRPLRVASPPALSVHVDRTRSRSRRPGGRSCARWASRGPRSSTRPTSTCSATRCSSHR